MHKILFSATIYDNISYGKEDATKVEIEEDLVEAYLILVGGRTGIDSQIGRLLCESVPVDEISITVAAIIEHYLAQREGTDTFSEFAAKHDWSAYSVTDFGLRVAGEGVSSIAGEFV